MMQLLGYHLVEYINGLVEITTHVVTTEDVDVVLPLALEAYERRALRPMMSVLAPSAQSYLRAMAATAGENHIARTGDIAKYLGKTHQQLTSTRKMLVDEGIIVACGHGQVRFAVPYLRAYMSKPDPTLESLALLEEWDV